MSFREPARGLDGLQVHEHPAASVGGPHQALRGFPRLDAPGTFHVFEDEHVCRFDDLVQLLRIEQPGAVHVAYVLRIGEGDQAGGIDFAGGSHQRSEHVGARPVEVRFVLDAGFACRAAMGALLPAYPYPLAAGLAGSGVQRYVE